MSLTSRIFVALGLALVLLSCCVDAHGWMSSPSPRGQYASPKRYPYEEIAPASTNPDSPNFVCRSDPEMPRANWLPLTAGESQTIKLDITAKHVGDCFVYLTYDGDKPITEMKWFKVWEQHACRDKDSYDITIPSYLPSGEHVIFRWEWYALHVFPVVEYYAQCVDATLAGSSQGRLPSPQVTMPGHLPKSAGNHADNTNNYWYPFGEQAMFFTGPALATLNGQPNPTVPASTKPPTPTVAPTPKATSAPPVAPTQRPEPATVAPTTPAATVAPTTPAATVAPTVAPTKPAATVPPTTSTSAPSYSVKLNVLGGTSFWWFSAEVVGHRSDQVVKVEGKDAAGNTFAANNDWGHVWAAGPGAQGPFVYPVTVKASLASGSSVYFSVNRPSITTIDSGDVFP